MNGGEVSKMTLGRMNGREVSKITPISNQYNNCETQKYAALKIGT